MRTKISIVYGDIASLKVDAIVNAANKKFTESLGAQGGIFKMAGEELFKACLRLGECKIGEAKITSGYNLPAKYVIHTVSPAYGAMDGMEASFLEDCYKNCLSLADKHNLETLAFPNISAGSYGFPIQESAPIALESILEYLQENPETKLKELILLVTSEVDYKIYKEIWRDYLN